MSVFDLMTGGWSGGLLSTVSNIATAAANTVGDAVSSLGNNDPLTSKPSKSNIHKHISNFDRSVTDLSGRRDSVPNWWLANGGTKESWWQKKEQESGMSTRQEELEDLAIEEGRYSPDVEYFDTGLDRV